MARAPLHPILILLAALAIAGPAFARADGKEAAKPRTPPPAAKITAVPAAKRIALTTNAPPIQSLPILLQSGGGFRYSGLAANGLHSSLPLVGDKAAECRSACTQIRITCGGEDECSTRWVQCLATCNR